jgi:uncharacterized protein YecE (DUF72 family)
MQRYRVGCCGWDYKGWIGKFYPEKAKAADLLRIYSEIFQTVEVDSTFYGIPRKSTIDYWYNSTPEEFSFSLKVPRAITHKNQLKDSKALMDEFLSRALELEDKLGVILLQLPPYFERNNGLDSLNTFLDGTPDGIKLAVEFRNNSWYTNDVYNSLQNHKVCLVWSSIPNLNSKDSVTSNFLYLRLVGDRSIPESEFGTVKREMTSDMDKWLKSIKDKNSKENYIFANNHYEGFSPHTVREITNKMGLNTPSWFSEKKHVKESVQKELFDFS